MERMELYRLYELNDMERRIMDNIFNALEDEKKKIGIREIASESYVSTATVIRLSKKLGYQGYSDMLHSLRAAGEREGPHVDPNGIYETIDSSCIETFAEEILRHKNNCIYIFALGNSTIAASYMVRRLAAVGIAAYDGSPIDVMRNDIAPSMVLVISKSGEAPELLRLTALIKKMGHRIYLITAKENSPLTDLCEQSLVVKTDCESGNGFVIPDYFIGRTIILFEYILAALVIRMQEEPKDPEPQNGR